jgi:lipid-A-disaccharide synthase
MKFYLVAGETSGDSRGAELIRALSPRFSGAVFHGAGGSQMRLLCSAPFLEWTEHAVVGLWDVLRNYPYFKRQFERMRREIALLQPDAVIFIDYPGFNLRLAKALRAAHPRLQLLYYISPQVWAWNRGRIPKMAQFLDLMLCLFPFETDLYQNSGLRAVCVGHPLLDSLAQKNLGISRDPDLVALLPGSREKEVRKIFPVLLRAARELRRRRPGTRFLAAAASDKVGCLMADLVSAEGLDPGFCPIRDRAAHALMQQASAGMVASGTATLEAAYFGMPMIIVYKVAWLTWVVGKLLVKVPFLGMPNLLAGREIAREFLQSAATPEPMAEELQRLLDSPKAGAEAARCLADVIVGLGRPGAADRAAEAIHSHMNSLPPCGTPAAHPRP